MQSCLPERLILDATQALAVLHESFLEPRGKEELVRQCFDALLEASPQNDLFHAKHVPFVEAALVPGFARMASQADKEQLQLTFTDLYVGLRQVLVRHGVDRLVEEAGSFDYVLDHIREQRTVVLRHVPDQEKPHYG